MSDPRQAPEPPDDAAHDGLCGGDPLARALARLAPAPTGLATPAFLFEAGRASQAPAVTFWRRVCLGQTALVGCGAVLLAVWGATPGPPHELASRAAAPTPEKLRDTTRADARATAPQAAESAPPPREVLTPLGGTAEATGFAVRTPADEPSVEERARWLRLRNDVLAGGLGVLPTPAPVQGIPADLGGPRYPGLRHGVFASPPVTPRPKPAPEPPPEDQ